MVSNLLGRDKFRDQVDGEVIALFGLVTEALVRATAALLEQDVELAGEVISDDSKIDQRCETLTGIVSGAISDPVSHADELEDLVAILQIISELERSADLAEHIAQRTLQGLGGIITAGSRGLIQEMCDTAARMWRAACEAYRSRSRDAGFQLGEADDALDELAARLVASGLGEAAQPRVAVDLALIARFYERLGDHAVNLARRVDSMVAPRRLAGVSMRRGHHRPARPAESHGGSGLWARLKGMRLVPADTSFFDLFRDAAENARDCATELGKLMVSPAEVDARYDRIREIEHRGDEITVELLRRLDAAFVTPFDREDIHALAEKLDDVVDDMFAAASIVRLVRFDEPLPEMVQTGDILVSMADEMVALVEALSSREGSSSRGSARHRLQRIEHLERQGDVVFRRSMERLFSGEFDTLDVLKWKDVVQTVEDALNAVEDVSDVVESILVKTS